MKTAFKSFITLKTPVTPLTTGQEYLDALKKSGFQVSPWAENFLGSNAFQADVLRGDIPMVKITASELGFKDGAKISKVYDKALEFGLALCSEVMGPLLRLQYIDQPAGEYLFIASAPFEDSERHQLVFGVDHGLDGMWLGCPLGSPDRWWRADQLGVFVKSD